MDWCQTSIKDCFNINFVVARVLSCSERVLEADKYCFP
jgi:hypothetical protein